MEDTQVGTHEDNGQNATKVRILFIISTLAMRGPVRQLYNLVKYLDYKRFAPTVLTLSPEPDASLAGSFYEIGVPCYSLALSRLVCAFLGVPRLKQFFSNHPADVVHALSFRANLLTVIALGGVPRITTERGSFFETNLTEYGHLLGYIYDKSSLKLFKKFERVVVPSESVRSTLPPGLRPAVTVIHNGVDNANFRPVHDSELAELKKKLKLPPGRFTFISVGHLSAGKDPITVLRAFLNSDVAQNGMMVFLGDGPLRADCERLSMGHHNVRFVGFTSNVLDYLRASEFFVSASLSEGCPNTVMEALACGLPVVLSDIASHREILYFNRRAGYLSPVKNVPAMAACLERIMNDHYQIRSEAALSIIHNHFNAYRMSNHYQALYVTCLEEFNRNAQR